MDTDVAYNEDCLNTMKRFPDELVDMVFADPPFNTAKKYNEYDDKMDIVAYKQWYERWVYHSFRILKPTGTLWVMAINGHLPWLFSLLAKDGVFVDQVIWKNVSPCRNNRQFVQGFQPILVFGKTDEYLFNPVAETHPERQQRWGKWSTGTPLGRLTNIWDDISFVYTGSVVHPEAILVEGTKKRVHPCQMPIQLAQRAIQFGTNEGDTVYIPFAGTGTACVAALRNRRRFIASEIDLTYYGIIQNRLEEERTSLLTLADELAAKEQDERG